MYRLTPRMLQHLTTSLGKYHDLFMSGRCSGWELEELIVAAIKSDTQAQHQVRWKEGGHDAEADITVKVNGNTHFLQIKSGKTARQHITLSGHRLGRYKGNLNAITEYLNEPKADMVSAPCRKDDGERGRQYVYRICYIDAAQLAGVKAADWVKHGAIYRQTNRHGVEFSLRPSMSWQIWWKIPLSITEQTDEIVIG